MSTFLSKRRKHELKDIATSLGLSVDGVREDLVDRIKNYVSKHGTDIPSLQDLVRETTHSRESRLASLSSANEDEDTSDGATSARVTRSSPKKTHASTAAPSRRTRPESTSIRSGSDSDSVEDPLSEHRVRDFMEHVQDELHEAKELAHSLEQTLQDKYNSGKQAIRRASNDFSSTVSHALGDVVEAVTGHGSSSNVATSTRHRSRHYGHADDHERGWFGNICEEVKHRFANCAGACGFSSCISEYWKRLHDIGSTSVGFVWLTLVLELLVFLTSAFSHHDHSDGEGWISCLGFFTNWADFLKPFFSYYITLFVLPTLLSQLFNVDRSSASRSSKHSSVTGLLSRKTTSGLSYFVFKFALTYFLSQTSVASHHHESSGLLGLAKEAAETVASHTGFGSHHPTLLEGCKFLGEVFRYVPPSLGLATSGAGTILALAESIVSRH
ncbi:hypothetical protein EMPS_00305 [Entomortierella parvispora]|uniref:SAP domain-containing protein n=1 Tax=Entomortierella parvispora TaxID=205924 RepID=A0A9P3LRK7_9FUNG|nr:hypothetical protein EMPS_00305 [Entomortierella parvispora]